MRHIHCWKYSECAPYVYIYTVSRVIQPAENSSIRRRPQKNKPQAEFCSKLDTVKKSRDAVGVLNRRGRQFVARTSDGPRITS